MINSLALLCPTIILFSFHLSTLYITPILVRDPFMPYAFTRSIDYAFIRFSSFSYRNLEQSANRIIQALFYFNE